MGKSEISKAAQALAVAERKLAKLAERYDEQVEESRKKLDVKYEAAVAKIQTRLGAKTSKAAAAVATAKKTLTDLVAQA